MGNVVEVSNRLFTFGCSFTNYVWWTWADILGSQFNEFYNWGQSGGGNHYIFNSVMEADQRMPFTDGDTVIVCWTNILREDRYIKDRWITGGNIMTTSIFNKEFLADSVCERGLLIRDLAYIKAVKELLKNRPGVKWEFLSMCPIVQPDQYSDTKIQFSDVTNLYHDVIGSIHPSIMEVLGDKFWQENVKEKNKVFKPFNVFNIDMHPTTNQHLKYLDTVLPGWVTNAELRESIKTEILIKHKRGDGICKQPRL